MPILPENRARYPKDWPLRSRFIRFYRARNKCEWCGAKNYEPHPETGSKVVLTVAHVWDHNPENAAFLEPGSPVSEVSQRPRCQTPGGEP